MPGPDQRRFIPRIEAMRGCAALTVAAMHVTSSYVAGPSRGGLDAIGLQAITALTNGYGAVVAFFVISGFVLARSLDRNFGAARFIRGRVFRLFPAAITTVAIFAALFLCTGFNLYKGASYTPLNIVANMLMLHADIDAVMWSMKAELAATPLVFFAVWLGRRYGARPLLAIAAVLFGLSFVGQYNHLIGDDTNLAPLYAFPVGILLHFRGGTLAQRLPPMAVAPGALASIAIFCACAFFKPSGTWTLLTECLSAAGLVLLIAHRTDAAIFTLLDHPIVRFYGRISYSFYLLHPLSLWASAQLTRYLLDRTDGVPLSLILAASFIFSVAAVTPLAYASWRFVEWPAMNLRSALARARLDRPAVVSGET
jgi:peptidoglycan/LPS O-acetylase OafA/YrhL